MISKQVKILLTIVIVSSVMILGAMGIYFAVKPTNSLHIYNVSKTIRTNIEKKLNGIIKNSFNNETTRKKISYVVMENKEDQFLKNGMNAPTSVSSYQLSSYSMVTSSQPASSAEKIIENTKKQIFPEKILPEKVTSSEIIALYETKVSKRILKLFQNRDLLFSQIKTSLGINTESDIDKKMKNQPSEVRTFLTLMLNENASLDDLKVKFANVLYKYLDYYLKIFPYLTTNEKATLKTKINKLSLNEKGAFLRAVLNSYNKNQKLTGLLGDATAKKNYQLSLKNDYEKMSSEMWEFRLLVKNYPNITDEIIEIMDFLLTQSLLISPYYDGDNFKEHWDGIHTTVFNQLLANIPSPNPINKEYLEIVNKSLSNSKAILQQLIAEKNTTTLVALYKKIKENTGSPATLTEINTFKNATNDEKIKLIGTSDQYAEKRFSKLLSMVSYSKNGEGTIPHNLYRLGRLIIPFLELRTNNDYTSGEKFKEDFARVGMDETMRKKLNPFHLFFQEKPSPIPGGSGPISQIREFVKNNKSTNYHLALDALIEKWGEYERGDYLKNDFIKALKGEYNLYILLFKYGTPNTEEQKLLINEFKKINNPTKWNEYLTANLNISMNQNETREEVYKRIFSTIRQKIIDNLFSKVEKAIDKPKTVYIKDLKEIASKNPEKFLNPAFDKFVHKHIDPYWYQQANEYVKDEKNMKYVQDNYDDIYRVYRDIIVKSLINNVRNYS